MKRIDACILATGIIVTSGATAYQAAAQTPESGSPPQMLAQAAQGGGSGRSAGTEGGAGDGGQYGTPPGQLAHDQEMREQAGKQKSKQGKAGAAMSASAPPASKKK